MRVCGQSAAWGTRLCHPGVLMGVVTEPVWAVIVVLAVAAHFAFLGYLVIGGFLAWRRPATLGLHVAAVGWGAASLALGLPCPLTDLERYGRAGAGMAPLPPEGFIEHYLVGNWYPAAVAEMVPALAFAAVAVSWIALGLRRRQRSAGSALDHASAASEL